MMFFVYFVGFFFATISGLCVDEHSYGAGVTFGLMAIGIWGATILSCMPQTREESEKS